MSEKNTNHALIILVIFVILIGILGAIFYRQEDSPQPLSVLNVNPSGNITPTLPPEPVITQWRTYENNDYSFRIDVPENWHEQEYKSSETKEGMIIAFSPNPLPCATCTYFFDGFFSVRVFNQTSNPESYTEFQKRMKNLGKHQDYRGVYLGEKVGIGFANTIAVEHNGWVYEVSLDTDKGQAPIDESPIFKKALSSFRFTSLFNN